MLITGLDVTTVPVNRRGDWLFVRLISDEGLVGLGEGSHGGEGPERDAIVATILTRQCLPLLRGRDPRAVLPALAALSPLYASFAGRTAVSACEQALWDLAGQALGVPIHQLFGGPTRDRIPLYANINRATTTRTPAEFARLAGDAVAAGFRAVKLAPFDGLGWRQPSGPAVRARIAQSIECVAAVREAVGPEIDVYVDYHSHFTVAHALEVARELRALGVTWCEEPVPTTDIAALQRLRPHLEGLGVEHLGGEHLGDLGAYWPYLVAGIWDTIMPDVKHCGGIAAAVTLGRAAAARGVGIAPHNPSGPVAMAATAQVAASLPEVRAVEYAWGEVPWRAELITPAERIVDGMLELPRGPGLGIALNEQTIAAQHGDA